MKGAFIIYFLSIISVVDIGSTHIDKFWILLKVNLSCFLNRIHSTRIVFLINFLRSKISKMDLYSRLCFNTDGIDRLDFLDSHYMSLPN